MPVSRRGSITEFTGVSTSRRASVTGFNLYSARGSITEFLPSVSISIRRSLTDFVPADFATVYLDVDEDTWQGLGTEQIRPEITMSLSGVDVRPYLKKLTLSRPFNGKISAKCVFSNTYTDGIEDEISDLVPPGAGPFAGLVRPCKIDGTGRYLDITISVLGNTKIIPRLYPLEPSHDGFGLDWAFEDKQKILEDTVSELDDIVYEEGDRRQIKEVQEEAAALVGLSVQQDFDDMAISRLDRHSNSLLDIVDACSKVVQAGRRMVGNCLHLSPRRIGSPRWFFRDGLNILACSKTVLRPKNKYNLVRIEPVGGTLGQLKRRNRLGFDRIDLTTPKKYVVLEINAFNCFLSVFQYFDAGDNLLNFGPGSNSFSADVPIAYVKFIAAPGGLTILESEYSIIARGVSRPDFGAREVEKNESTLQGIYGVVPENSVIQDSVILDFTSMDKSGDAYLNEAALSANKLVLSTLHANPHMEPGETIAVTDKITNQTDENWFIDEHVFEWDGSGEIESWSSVLNCSHGE